MSEARAENSLYIFIVATALIYDHFAQKRCDLAEPAAVFKSEHLKPPHTLELRSIDPVFALFFGKKFRFQFLLLGFGMKR